MKIFRFNIGIDRLRRAEKIEEKIEVKDVLTAKNIAQKYLAKKGILIWSSEISSIFKRRLAWFVEIECIKFNGYIVIGPDTGKVMAAVDV